MFNRDQQANIIMMNWKEVWNILRWVLAVLAAGFIGHFGRVLAERIINRSRGGAARNIGRSGTEDPQLKLEKKRIKAQEKLEKKRIKANLKKEKKGREK